MHCVKLLRALERPKLHNVSVSGVTSAAGMYRRIGKSAIGKQLRLRFRADRKKDSR